MRLERGESASAPSCGWQPGPDPVYLRRSDLHRESTLVRPVAALCGKPLRFVRGVLEPYNASAHALAARFDLDGALARMIDPEAGNTACRPLRRGWKSKQGEPQQCDGSADWTAHGPPAKHEVIHGVKPSSRRFSTKLRATCNLDAATMRRGRGRSVGDTVDRALLSWRTVARADVKAYISSQASCSAVAPATPRASATGAGPAAGIFRRQRAEVNPERCLASR